MMWTMWFKEYRGIGFCTLIDDFLAVAGTAAAQFRLLRRRLLRVLVCGVLLSAVAGIADETVRDMVPEGKSTTAKHWAREISSKSRPYNIPGIITVAMWLAGSVWGKRRLRLAAVAAVLSFTIAGLSVDVLKFAAGRARPEIGGGWQPLSTAEEFQSFPSAHTAVAFATAVAVAEVYPATGVALVGGAAATGWSRIYLLHHYLSDVVAGAYIGAMAGIILGAAARAAGKEPPPSPGGNGPD